MTAHIFLAIAALAVCAVVVVQDHLVPMLREKSISAGLTGPYHWYLDGAMVLLAAALVVAFSDGVVIQKVLAIGAAISLVLTAASGTYTTSLGVDGERIHAGLTAVTFMLAIALQFVTNHTASMWGITGLAIASAGVTHYLVPNASVTEKVGVLGLCAWLIAL